MSTLFEPITIGKLELPSRLFMAPMTRNRATLDGRVTELTAEYYAQRASAGLIISESNQPSVIGQGYFLTPGLHAAEQVEAWRAVTDAVHNAGGRIFAQLTHTGRIGHPALYPDGALPVAPSAVASGEQLFTPDGMIDHPTPRELTVEDIKTTVADFVSAARNAIDAGFDGVELHGANGYLLHQFLADNTNLRTDEYGGSVENKIRVVLEVASAVINAIGADRTGIRLSPANPFNNIVEADPAPLYTELLSKLAELNLAYVHIIEGGSRELTKTLRAAWPGTFILNPHPTPEAFPATVEAATEALESGVADAVTLGALWLANPDLDARIKAGGPYNTPDQATFYGGDHTGYTDYPTLDKVASA
ncbi:alkene reductase [Nocardia puris]|uniref:N-ethylmaleimide reductase n=1 Tax=Nocardia puris TaxID=208602 RepID=A0A366DDX8_9NOCA|nr:alkene reductase [Nocardia puris]MBF6214997.1 alkene reductase [Nocardia puris]MBF6367236.1 alkene reductase [Nocardia puris]MBF6461787.1 alkene reductase [Nocardia puris]RBO88243.1 N-ethylmaleimide reductase [Nocardia puris]